MSAYMSKLINNNTGIVLPGDAQSLPLVCPECRHRLTGAKDKSALNCPGCGLIFPIDSVGIIDFRSSAVRKNAYADSLPGRQFSHEDIARANASFYDRFEVDGGHDRRTEIHLATTLSRLVEQGAGRVLVDMGCGGGGNLEVARSHFDRCLGLEISATRGRLARARGFEIYLGDLTRTPFPDGSVDVVCYISVLHHLFSPREALREAARIVKIGGWIYVDYEPNWFLRKQINVRSFAFRRLVALGEAFNRIRGGRSEKGPSDEKDRTVKELAEFHYYYGSGLSPDELASVLQEYHFNNVEVYFHSNSTTLFTGRQVPFREWFKSSVARLASGSFRCLADYSRRSNSTQFALLARK
jgi:SAM-dependent methyltransferase